MAIGPIRQQLVEIALDAPASRRIVEAQQLRGLAAFRAGAIHPIAVAGIERAAVPQEVAQFGATHETAGAVALARRVGDGEALGRRRLRPGPRDQQSAGADRQDKIEPHPNRFHAACRETASASPIISQLTSRSRKISTTSCIAASTAAKAPLYPESVFNKVSVGALSGSNEGVLSVVALGRLLMIGKQRPTHSSQMNTPGPATSVFTSVWAL